MALMTELSSVPPQPTAAALSKAVVLRFGCWNVTKRDLLSQSDPFIVVFLTDVDSQHREILRTETATNMASVVFTRDVYVEYRCEEMQRLRVEVYDRDSPSEQLYDHQPLGCAEFSMAELMESKGLTLELPLQQPATGHIPRLQGTVTVAAEELSPCTDQVTFQLGADKLDRKNGWLGRSDPYISIYRLTNPDANANLVSSWLSVWTSSLVRNELNPRWPKETISYTLEFKCWDWEADGNHQLIGRCMMTAGEFLAGEGRSFDLINPAIQAKKGKKYVNSGVLRILSVKKHQ